MSPAASAGVEISNGTMRRALRTAVRSAGRDRSCYLPRDVFFGRLGFAGAFFTFWVSDFGRFFPATSDSFPIGVLPSAPYRASPDPWRGCGATYAWIGIWLAASAAGAAPCVTLLARAIGRGSGVGHRIRHPLRRGRRGDQDGGLRPARECPFPRLPDRLRWRRNGRAPSRLSTRRRAHYGPLRPRAIRARGGEDSSRLCGTVARPRSGPKPLWIDAPARIELAHAV
jgi:hypothetical protein